MAHLLPLEMAASVVGHPGLDPGIVAVPTLDILPLLVVMLIKVLAVDAKRRLRGQLRMVDNVTFFCWQNEFLLANPAGGVIQ